MIQKFLARPKFITVGDTVVNTLTNHRGLVIQTDKRFMVAWVNPEENRIVKAQYTKLLNYFNHCSRINLE